MQTLKHFIETEISKLEGFKIDFETNLGIVINEPPRYTKRLLKVIIDKPTTQDYFILYNFKTDRQAAGIRHHLDEVYCPDNLVIKKDPKYGDHKEGHTYNLVEVDDTEKFFDSI